jgi:tetratricopeptide (TPR) repeat protein
MAEPARPEIRYSAFLSYSHRDSAAGGRLHRRLETYRIPRRLVGTPTPRGTVPGRLWPIFRDRDELPAASDLSETVREALARSGALVVLCSPDAAESLWVAQEIEVFRRLHPDRPILAAIVAGEPPDCFPAPLRALGRDGAWHEPLATDLRAGRDGAHLGLLKLVAGITGVGLDALVQRDAARRIRRITAVTIAAVAAMLMMAALAWFAIDARREAERQRAEAEGLAKFMLTDLRERLREVGRLDIMRTVNARALAYHNMQLQLYHRPEDQIMRARVLHAIGEDDIARGNLDSALVSLREAHRITTDQLARARGDPQRLFDHARSEYWIGRVHELRQDWPAAERQYSRFAEAMARLIERAPANPDYMMEVGWSAFNLGNAQLATENPGAAQQSYEKAIDWFGRTARARPRDREAPRAQANAYGGLADSFYARDMWRENFAARRNQYRIVERLHRADPSNLQNAFRFALAQRAVGAALGKVNDPAGAQRQILGAYEWSLRLSASDPSNAEWLLFKAQVGCEIHYRRLALPEGTTADGLAADIRAVSAALRRRRDPRQTLISACVEGLDGDHATAR